MAASERVPQQETGSAHDGKGWRFALLVLSDKAASGRRPDACLPVMRAVLPPHSRVVHEQVIADDEAALTLSLKALSDENRADCVLTSGGTGLAPKDITPQVTSALADYEVPGIPEAMRAAGMLHVPTAMLSRAVAAVRKKTLIINLPGSPKAVAETLGVIAPVLPHALGILRGDIAEHPAQG